MKGLGNEKIYSHTKLSEGVFETKYENGTCVYVNYNEIDYVYNNLVITAGSFAVK